MIETALFMILLYMFTIIITAYKTTKFYNSVMSIAARDRVMHQCEKLLKQVLLTISIVLLLFSIVLMII